MGYGYSVERQWPPFPEALRELTAYDLNKDHSVVKVHPGHTIDCSLTEILDLCLSKFDTVEEQQAFRTFAHVVGMIVRFEITVLANEVGHNYRVCAPSIASQRLRQQMRNEGHGAELEAMQLKFIEQFCQVLRSADYCALSQGEWDIAATESFMFWLPVEVQWDCYDDRLISKFLDTHTELREFMPPWSKRLLVFRQGSSVATTTKWLFMEKSKRLLYLLFVKPLIKFAARLVGLRQRLRDMELPSPLSPLNPLLHGRLPVWDSSHALDSLKDFASTSGSRLSKLGSMARRRLSYRHALMPIPSISQDSLDDIQELPVPKLQETRAPELIRRPSSFHNPLWALAFQQRPKIVKHRVGLLCLLPTVWSVIQNFPKKLRLTEPTFKNVAILYCHTSKGEQNANNSTEVTEELDGIHIKLFRDIPLADLEVVFPFKRVALRNRDIMKTIATVAIGLWTAYRKLLQGGWTAGVMQAIATILIARGFSAIGGVRRAKVAMEREMHRTYVHKSMDNNEGALYYLLDCWERQELKEMLLAYTYCAVLQEEAPAHHTRRGVDMEDIRTVIEAELQDRLNLVATFNIRSAVDKLEQHHVVERQGRRLRPAPINDAVAHVRQKWDRYLQGCSSQPSTDFLHC